MRLKRGRWLVVVVSLLVCGVFGAVSTSSASALSLGLNWTGEYNQARDEMAIVGKSGAEMFRLPVEPGKSANGTDWTYYDEVFGAAAKSGVRILPVISGRFDGQSGVPSLAERPSWSEWVKQAVRRYGYAGIYWSTHPEVPAMPVVAWELWNEPNLPSGNFVPAAAFGEFLGWAGSAVQVASESWGGQKTGVLSGGLMAWSGGTNYQSYLKTAYNSGGSSAITGVALHPYELEFSSFAARIGAFESSISGARTFINGLSGGSLKSLWITETGWPAAAEYAVGEIEQAELLTASFNWAKSHAESLNLRALLWYNTRDLSTSIWPYRSGLRDSYGEYREAWQAFQAETGAPFWPPITLHYESLGSSEITGDPDIASVGSGHLNVFARGLDGNLWQKWTIDGVNWSGWQMIGGPIAGGPGAVAMNSERVDVVARLTNNGVGHWWYEGGGWHFQELGGEITGDPDISSAKNGYLNVFVRGLDGNLWQKFTSDKGATWSPWQMIGGQIVGGPSAVSWDSVRVDVVARLTNNGVGHWWYDGSAWHSDVLGGEIASRPSIASNQQGHLNVFVRGLDGNLWQKWWRNDFGVWSSWELVGGPIPGGPGATAWHPHRVDVVARMPNNSVGHWYYSP